MPKINERREFLRSLGLSAAALGAGGLFEKAFASPIAAGSNGRSLLDRITTPSNGLVLQDKGDAHYYLVASGLPDHATGQFPNANCPGSISPRALDVMNPMRISKTPALAGKNTALGGWLFGVALNGVAMDPTGPYWQGNPAIGWQFEVMDFARPYLGLDFNNAHTQPTGEYHYHGMPAGLILNLQAQQAARGQGGRMILLGWAADGFPVYAPVGHRAPRDLASPLVEMRPSYARKAGARPSGSPGGRHESSIFVQDYEYRAGTGDLDECNGRFGATPEFPGGIYHYFLTNAFPYIPRFWKGTPDGSFFHPQPGLDAVPRALLGLDYTRL